MRDFTTNGLLDAAKGRVEARIATGETMPDYRSISADFNLNAELDRCGLGQKLAEIEGEGGILPRNPATLRGKFGGIVFGLSSRALWWIPRAFRLRDSALRAVYEALLFSREEQLRELRELHARMDALERARATPKDS